MGQETTPRGRVLAYGFEGVNQPVCRALVSVDHLGLARVLCSKILRGVWSLQSARTENHKLPTDCAPGFDRWHGVWRHQSSMPFGTAEIKQTAGGVA